MMVLEKRHSLEDFHASLREVQGGLFRAEFAETGEEQTADRETGRANPRRCSSVWATPTPTMDFRFTITFDVS